MRLVVAAALVSVLPATAHAQAARPAIDPAQAAAALQNPLVQEGLAAAITQLAGIVLDTRVGPPAALADPDGDVRPRETLRDVERRRDPGFEAHLHDRARSAVASAGMVAGGVAGQSAEFKRTADRLKAALAPLMAYAHAPHASEEDR